MLQRCTEIQRHPHKTISRRRLFLYLQKSLGNFDSDAVRVIRNADSTILLPVMRYSDGTTRNFSPPGGLSEVRAGARYLEGPETRYKWRQVKNR